MEERFVTIPIHECAFRHDGQMQTALKKKMSCKFASNVLIMALDRTEYDGRQVPLLR